MKRNKTETQFPKSNFIKLLHTEKAQLSAPTTPRHAKFQSLLPKAFNQKSDYANHPILLSSLLGDINFSKQPLQTISHFPISNHYYCKSTTKNHTPQPSQYYQSKKLHLTHKPQRFLVKLNTKIPKLLTKESLICKTQTYRKPSKFHSISVDPKYQLISDITKSDVNAQITFMQNSPQQELAPIQQVTTKRKYKDCSEIDDFNNKLYGSKQIRELLNFQKFPSENLPQKEKFRLIRSSLLQYLKHLEKLKLTTQEFLSNRVFPNKPFDHPQSKQFFQLCKQGCNQEIIKMLEINKYLVYEYDHLLMTTLHWCAMRGLETTAKILLSYGADPDSQDIVGRTPLYQSLLHKQNNIAYFLILNKADPWNKMNLNYAESIQDNEEGKTMLHQTRRTHILLRMTPPDQRQFIWQKEQLQMYEPNKKKVVSL